ncbi:MAG: histidinol dehydrogenase, partial [Kingella oralis]
MKRLSTQSPQFQQELQALLAFETAQDPKIDQIVADICADVQRRGDAAVLEYTNRFDGTQAQTMADLTLSQDDLKAAFFRLPENVQTTLQTAAERVQ